MQLENKPGSNDPTSVPSYEGSSPRHQVVIQSLVNLPKKLEFDQTYRYVSALPAQTGWKLPNDGREIRLALTRELELSVGGQKPVAAALRSVRRRSGRAR